MAGRTFLCSSFGDIIIMRTIGWDGRDAVDIMNDKSNKPSKISDDVQQFSVDQDDDGIRLDRWFKRHIPQVSFAMVSRWSRTGQLRVDGKRADPGLRITPGQIIRVPPIEQNDSRPIPKSRMPLSDAQISKALDMVIYRDKSAIIINKPPGLATQGGTKMTQHVDGLLDALCYENDHRPKLVHRLDKDTSGALLLARTANSASHFAKHFAGRSARKIYWAIVMGVPDIDDGIIDLPLGKQPSSGGEKMQVDEENGQSAKSRYRIIERIGNRAAWVELTPYSGRTHQLRVHMAAIGHPIVGDGKYGGKECFLTGEISRKMHLHARRIRIANPSGGKLDVRADLPEHFAATMEALGLVAAEGDLPIDEGRGPITKAIKKKIAKNHSKNIRKDQRGARRSRGDGLNSKKSGTKGKKSDRIASGANKVGVKKSGPKKGKGSPKKGGR